MDQIVLAAAGLYLLFRSRCKFRAAVVIVAVLAVLGTGLYPPLLEPVAL